MGETVQVILEGVRDGRKIAAIKDLRSAAQIGLREAKNVIDLVSEPRVHVGAYKGGSPQRIAIPATRLSHLDDEGALIWHRAYRT